MKLWAGRYLEIIGCQQIESSFLFMYINMGQDRGDHIVSYHTLFNNLSDLEGKAYKSMNNRKVDILTIYYNTENHKGNRSSSMDV